MKIYRIKTGYELPIKGAAERTTQELRSAASVGLHPGEFRGVKPKLEVKVNDSVKAGTPLFHDKANAAVKFVAPASGRVTDIVYGARRTIEAIRIAPSGDDYEQHASYRPADIPSIKRDDLIALLLKGGLWPFIRRRPFGTIAEPGEQPSSIFVNAMDTAPLAADQEFLLEGQWEDYRAGVAALKILGKVNVVVDGRKPDTQFARLDGVSLYGVIGKHPAGNVGTHVSLIDPVIKPGKAVWTVTARDAARIGSFLLVGRFPKNRRIAAVGTGLKKNLYLDTVAGADAANVLSELLVGGGRLISGNVLSGRKIVPQGYIGFYDAEVTVVAEDTERHFIGWMMPGFSKPTYSRAYMSGFLPGRSYAMGTNLRGEPRALVKTGDYQKVVALDILPDYLAKAILAQDIDLMEQLGMLECAPEDFALCSYICPSKTEFTEIVQQGLDLMQKEVS